MKHDEYETMIIGRGACAAFGHAPALTGRRRCRFEMDRPASSPDADRRSHGAGEIPLGATVLPSTARADRPPTAAANALAVVGRRPRTA